MKAANLCLILFLISLSLTAQPPNDNFASAIDVTGSINGCSIDAAYTTASATPDLNPGSCWNNSGPINNVWFKFTAPASGVINIKVDRGGTKGSLRATQLAVWGADGVTELGCDRYNSTIFDVITLGVQGLTPNNTYYISVDNVAGGTNVGTFTLCLDDYLDYDFYEAAINVSSLINGCSTDAAFTTYGASPDRNAGSCWNNGGPLFNRWFYFVATTTDINITVDRGGIKGSLRALQIAVWENDGLTQVACDRYTSVVDDDVTLGIVGLTPGNTYYISVDTKSVNYDGSFTLCLNDYVDYDFYKAAINVTSLINGCSADAEFSTFDASPDYNAGSCWNNSGPKHNRWFYFVATTAEMNITVDRGGSKGTQRRTQIALWESDGLTPVECSKYTSTDNDDVVLGVVTLTPGNTYYISIDTYNTSYDGSFTLCLADVVDYDFYESALNVSGFIGGCSADAAYSTIGASPDQIAGSCWNNSGPKFNRWFKFVATATGIINITIDIGGAKGGQRRTQIALWENDGITEIACNKFYTNAGTDDVVLGALGLTPGNTYYISVDSYWLSYDGTFTLCIDDEVDYDFYEGAIELTDLNQWCSPAAEYNTAGATSDQISGSCWNSSVPKHNRWFKFTALYPNVLIEIKIASGYGTQKRTELALWESDGVSEVACTIGGTYDNVSINYSGLTIGNEYYISVDTKFLGDAGSFTICIDNVDENYYTIADGIWANNLNWSATLNGPPGLLYPDVGDVTHIRHTIDVSSNEVCAEVNLICDQYTPSAAVLNINGGNLSVAGPINMLNTGYDLNNELKITGGGDVYSNDIYTANRNGGNNKFNLIIGNASELTINKDLEWVSSGGGSINNEILLVGSAELFVGRDLILNNIGGIKTDIKLSNTSILTVVEDIEYIASADNKNEIELNNTSSLIIKKSIVRGSPAYGILSSNDNSLVNYNGDSYQQIVAGGGSGTGDLITYQNVIFDNTFIIAPQFEVEGGFVTIPRNMTLSSGIVETSIANLLVLNNGSNTLMGSSSSYIEGPIKKIGNSAYTFHVGKNTDYAPMGIAAPSVATDAFTAEYFDTDPDPLYDRDLLDPFLDHISECEYWVLDRSNGSSSIKVTLSWDVRSCGVDVLPELAIARWDGSMWRGYANGGTTGNNSSGTVITSTNVTSFSPFTLASTSLNNPLPIELIQFQAILMGDQVDLTWQTASELNNDFFSLEKSVNSHEWEVFETISGAGNSNTMLSYYSNDPSPFDGVSYYRLKQTDYNGEYQYSNIVSIDIVRPGGSFTVYPNPVGDVMTLKYDQCDKCTVEVFSTMGQLVYRGMEFSIDTRSWGHGVYEVHVISANGEIIGNSRVVK